MIKRLFLVGAFALALIALPNAAFTNSSGAPAGRTGSPVEGARTCNASGCHAGTAVNSGSGSISVVSPASYAPGQTVALAVTVQQEGAQRIGFEISVVGPDDMQIGTLQIVPGSGLRFASNHPGYLTHTNAPFNQSTRTFDVAWLAPSTPSVPVRFFIAANAANGNGSPSGDQIYTTVVHLGASGVAVEDEILPSHFSILSAFPNPAADLARIAISLPTTDGVSVRVFDLLGRERLSRRFTSMGAGRHELPVTVAGLPIGSYMVVIQTDSGSRASRQLTILR